MSWVRLAHPPGKPRDTERRRLRTEMANPDVMAHIRQLRPQPRIFNFGRNERSMALRHATLACKDDDPIRCLRT